MTPPSLLSFSSQGGSRPCRGPPWSAAGGGSLSRDPSARLPSGERCRWNLLPRLAPSPSEFLHLMTGETRRGRTGLPTLADRRAAA